MMLKSLKETIHWKRLILLAVASGVLTAVLNCIPFLEGTSFTAPAETLELWIVLAVYVVMHSEGYLDAGRKTFLFFLISQPLIYLVEVPFLEQGWSLFRYYPFWGILTLFTFPGAMLAYRMKKDDLLSVLILSAANLLMIFTGCAGLVAAIYTFPKRLLAVLFCMCMPFVLVFFVLKKKKSRITALVLATVMLAAGIVRYTVFREPGLAGYPLEEGTWTVDSVSGDGIRVSILEDTLEITSYRPGTYTVVLRSEEGEELCYEITVQGETLLADVEKKSGAE